MKVPESIQFSTKGIDKTELESALLSFEIKGFKRSTAFVKIFNLGLHKYFEDCAKEYENDKTK